jgi:hypothetical protein
MRKSLKSLGVLLLVAIVVTSGLGVAASSSQVNTDADAAHNPTVETDVTKEAHQMGWSPTEYEDDSGDLATLDGEVNDSADNPYSFVATDVDFSDASSFPNDKSDVSALDASEYTKTGANSGKLTVSDAETAPGVDAVRFETDGSMTSGDVAAGEFSNFSVTSDENKRMLQLGLDIATLDSGTTVEVRVIDEDGDYKTAVIDSSRSSGQDFVAGETGEGFVYQQKLGELATEGSGDGSFNNVETVQFRVMDGDADLSVMAINAEKMSKWTLGEELRDTDSDDELESVTIEEVKTPGAISIKSLTSMGSTFDSATINELTMPIQFSAEHLDSEDVHMETSSADGFPSFDHRVDVYYRLNLPAAYDLSYTGAELTDTVELPGSRYQTVEYKEGAGDTDFKDVSYDTDVTGQYDSSGATVTIDSTIQPGNQLALHFDYVVTQDELDAMQSSGGGGGAPLAQSDGGGGPIDWIVGSVMGLLALVGLKKKG